MMEQQNNSGNNYVQRSLEVTVKVGLVMALLVWCFLILKPFIMVTLWGVILAVAVHPMYRSLSRLIGQRKKIAAVIVTLILLMIILLPIALLGGSLTDAVVFVKDALTGGQNIIPPPSEDVKSWPLVGEPLYKLWSDAHLNLSDFVADHRDQLVTGVTWFVSAMTNAGLGVLMFIVSIIISGFFLVFSDEGADAMRRIFVRLMGDRGIETVTNAEATIRSVARGILGVAFIQAFLAGLGFLVAGIPGAGLWALIGFVLAIIQVGVGPVIIVVLIYAFAKLSMLTAILLTIWCVPLMVIDNILKPILLGRGAPVPMLVVFLGAIGGFIAFGTIGLFVGAVVLSLGYNLFLVWLKNGEKHVENA